MKIVLQILTQATIAAWKKIPNLTTYPLISLLTMFQRFPDHKNLIIVTQIHLSHLNLSINIPLDQIILKHLWNKYHFNQSHRLNYTPLINQKPSRSKMIITNSLKLDSWVTRSFNFKKIKLFLITPLHYQLLSDYLLVF